MPRHHRDIVLINLSYDAKQDQTRSNASCTHFCTTYLPTMFFGPALKLLVICFVLSVVYEGSGGTDNTFGPHIKLVPCERKQHQSPLPIHL